MTTKRTPKKTAPKKPKPARSKARTKARPKARPKPATITQERDPEYLLRLYVAGHTPKAMKAWANLEQICQAHLAGRYTIEIVDLLQNPALARGHQILALPTVVRHLPQPVKKVIGDFSDLDRVLVGLDLLSTRRTT